MIKDRCMMGGRCAIRGRYVIGNDSSLGINVPLNFVFKYFSPLIHGIS
jgi:hypothetical protein